MLCNNSTKRWRGCKKIAKVHLVTWVSKFGFPVKDGPLDLWLCHVHVKGWEFQKGDLEINASWTDLCCKDAV